MLSRQLNVVSFAECLVCIELPSIRILGRAEGKGDSTCRALDIMQHSLKRISFHQWLVLRGALCDILRHSCGKAFTKSGSTDLRQSLSKVICTLSSWRYQVHCINRVMLTSSFVCSRNSMDFILDHIFLYASCTGSANLDRELDFCSYPKAWHITVIGKDNSVTPRQFTLTLLHITSFPSGKAMLGTEQAVYINHYMVMLLPRCCCRP